jgi:hypothetical protein
MAHAIELLCGTNVHVKGEHSCRCWRSIPLPHRRCSQALIEKMVANQSWGEERKQQKGMHTVKEIDMLAAKIDLLLSRLNERVHEKEAMKATV